MPTRVAPGEIQQIAAQGFRLPDGTVLSAPRERLPAEVSLDDWLLVDGWPWQVTNLLARSDNGKVIHLHGHPPISRGPNAPVQKFTGVRS
ncbi:hypothetical protein ACFC26_22010 [Kitasatospora purpeofusca]|uniref:hypothetical protein n=1 Tax=Kitasatospora purpeofusca TaxID=67352 RepID=UPI0035D91230